MNVTRIIVVSLAIITLAGLVILGERNAAKTRDIIKSQDTLLERKASEINELNKQNQQLGQDLDAASQQKNVNQDEVNKLEQQKQELERQRQELESQLQANLNTNKAGLIYA